MSEALFLITLAVNAYNLQYGKTFRHSDFCVMSIDPAPNFELGYEIVTITETDALRLRIYLNHGNSDQLSKYRLEVNHPSYSNALGDEVFVALGEIDNYYIDNRIYTFKPINTCGFTLNMFIDETGEPLLSEEGEYFIVE